MKAVKRKEILRLLDRGTFKVIHRRDIPEGANKLGGRYVLSIKYSGTNKEIWDVRYVIQGHRDHGKDIMVRSSSNVQQISLRFVLPSLGFWVLNFGLKTLPKLTCNL
jgi:hypothetical protein